MDSNPTNCILCRQPTEHFDPEHVFPDSIGGTLVLENAVCVPCNSFLGYSVDAYLTNHTLVEFNRLFHKITGKSGALPNPLLHGQLAADGRKLRYEIGNDGKPIRIYTAPQFSEEKTEAGIKIHLQVHESDAHLAPEMLRKYVDRRGYNVSDSQLQAFTAIPQTIDKPEVNYNLNLDISRYRKGLLKIAYELAFHWIGPRYLDDPCARRISKFLLDENSDFDTDSELNLRGTIEIKSDALLPKVGMLDQPVHTGMLWGTPQGLMCCVSIFDVFEARILVAESLTFSDPAESQCIIVDPVARTFRELRLPEFFAETSAKHRKGRNR